MESKNGVKKGLGTPCCRAAAAPTLSAIRARTAESGLSPLLFDTSRRVYEFTSSTVDAATPLPFPRSISVFDFASNLRKRK
jgi:hypothetical protein